MKRYRPISGRLSIGLARSGTFDQPEISGFAFFIRREVWENFGGFDEKLPDYGNESELCIRLLKSGYSFKGLKKALGEAGFRDIEEKKPQDYHTKDEPCLGADCVNGDNL